MANHALSIAALVCIAPLACTDDGQPPSAATMGTGGTGNPSGGTGDNPGETADAPDATADAPDATGDPPGGSGGSTGETEGTTEGMGDPPSNASWKPRVIHTTDLGADPDDEQSMVRQLVMANWFDIEGLIVATGCWRKNQSNTNMLDDLVDAYGEVVANLQVHDPDFPSVEYLRSVSVMGQTGYGMGDVGEGMDSDGSNMIIDAVFDDDPRPVWATCWGGCNTIAQALWTVQNTQPEELDEFVSRLRVYDILGQDNAGTWMAKTFPDLIYIRAKSVYSWQPSDSWLDQNVQSHGALGAAYPDRMYATEGDSPAIFHLIPNGLHDPDEVDWGGWGGRFDPDKQSGIRGMSCMSGEDQVYDPYFMYTEATESISRWSQQLENDFAARMDWSITSDYDEANHHPVAVVNDDTGRGYLEITASVGSSVDLSAAGSSDPDGDDLSYSWWIYDEPSSGSGSVDSRSSESATVSVGSKGAIHVVLEVVDNGSPSLTAYRRVVINGQ